MSCLSLTSEVSSLVEGLFCVGMHTLALGWTRLEQRSEKRRTRVQGLQFRRIRLSILDRTAQLSCRACEGDSHPIV
jgi:hypothetical protein